MDFGKDGPSASSVCEKANHALVFMFQPLGDTYTQPIAVFASKGPVKGETLAKLVLKAIILLERAGAKIHGLASDGASSNRKLWTILRIHGQLDNVRSSFQHPLDPKLKRFALRVHHNQMPIKWDRFIILHENDRLIPGELRIFSNSTALGLKFYQRHHISGLQDVAGTVEFCQQVNGMFEALNRSNSSQGVYLDSADFMVLRHSKSWLDDWERKKNNGNITASQFLTMNAAEGLRVTLNSLVEIIPYLHRFGFESVLTGGINQDSLERYFGSIRQAAGANDHPSAVTFLQLYKLMTVYGILKPPKYGNCSASEQTPLEPIIKIKDIKDIYSLSNN